MRMRTARSLLAVTGAALLLVPAASAHAGGGAAYVSPSASGGATFGTPARPVQARPVATFLAVSPRRVRAGTMPNVQFRIRQRGVSAVQARLMILPLGKRRPVVDVRIGDVRTGHTQTVRWPKRAALAAGRYTVSLHATDPTGRTLARRARQSGQAILTVTAPPPPAPAPAPAPVPVAPPVVAPSLAGVFPVQGPHSFGGDGSRFGAGRKGHIHQGQDLTAAAGTPVVAPTAGTVIAVDYQKGGAGYYVTLHAVDGRDLFFCHFQKDSTAVALNQVVSAGTVLGRVGSTGSSSGPHLHFEIWVGGWRRSAASAPVDPLAQLQAWDV
jgi:murein DD-endopeptidase MepM/ murein hydrolase activator NlpD